MRHVSKPMSLSRISLGLLFACAFGYVHGQGVEPAPVKPTVLPPEVAKDAQTRPLSDRGPQFRTSKSGIPTVEGGTVPPSLKPTIQSLGESSSRTQIERLAARVREDQRFRDIVKSAERTELLDGRLVTAAKDESGKEIFEKTGRLRWFAYEINRVVVVDIDDQGRVLNLRVREKEYEAPLSRAEVQRAIAIARRDERAPKDLSRFSVAGALVRPPDESGARIAYVMFRLPTSLVWRYEAFVDLSANRLREINRIQ